MVAQIVVDSGHHNGDERRHSSNLTRGKCDCASRLRRSAPHRRRSRYLPSIEEALRGAGGSSSPPGFMIIHDEGGAPWYATVVVSRSRDGSVVITQPGEPLEPWEPPPEWTPAHAFAPARFGFWIQRGQLSASLRLTTSIEDCDGERLGRFAVGTRPIERVAQFHHRISLSRRQCILRRGTCIKRAKQ